LCPQEERAQWGRQAEFILTLVGYAVGLGNVWRFPYLCYKSGGGAFLIPYVICLVFLGIPIFALEVSLGQFGGQGPITVWNINPAAKGVGMTAIALSSMVLIYYNVVIAWALRFFIASLTDHLPWEDCGSCQCLLYTQPYLDTNDPLEIEARNLSTVDANNQTIPFIDDLLVNNSYGLNCSMNESLANVAKSRSPSEVFFWDTILNVTPSIEETGEVQWQLLLCNLAAFAIVFLVLLKGIQSLGKVVYFTAIFPYILLTILLVRGCTLEGAGEGVRYYLSPDWERLSDATVWSDAAVQIFFSLSACMGGLIAMSSYNNFNNNVIRDAFVVPIINCATSFFSGFVVFSTLGHMAHTKQTSVDNVTAQGPGLVFVVYPEALSQMPVSPLWAILFFFMVCILGFSTQFSASETVMTSILDQFPHTFNTGPRRTLMRASVCLLGFLLGIPMVTGSGNYLLSMVDEAVLGYPVLTVGLMECLVVVIIYGFKNFSDDIKTMVGYSPPLYFKLCWTVITPVLLVGVIVFKGYQEEGREVPWVNLMYWLIVIFPISIMPGWWFYYVCTQSKLTAYTPAWRARRETGTKGNLGNGDIELEVSVGNNDNSNDKGTKGNPGNGDIELEVGFSNNDNCNDNNDTGFSATDNKLESGLPTNAFDNSAYMHHKEEVDVRM
ncbi:sodium- and chloride-dependent glycine transporter 1-like, partial [Littorina saxatilis]|uniref:sodium- and chloride-dependent glycine transporter 1-like n=1 Tax=Littorina saxatilis TaxID=31220 RepID=UPI0038B544A3